MRAIDPRLGHRRLVRDGPDDAGHQLRGATRRRRGEARDRLDQLEDIAVVKTVDPEERQALDDAFRRDLERFESDRDSKIRKIREGGPV